MTGVLTGLLAGLGAFGISGLAWAQNHNGVPLGGRTATMGGAATAAGNDSAMPYLNPSGLAGVPGDIFGISATVYGWSQTDYDGMAFPGSTPEALGPLVIDHESAKAHSVFEIPSSVMYFSRLTPPEASVQQRLGMALVIPRAAKNELLTQVRARFPNTANGPTEFRDSYAESLSSTYYLIGPGYAVGFDGRLRLGLSLFAVYSRLVYSSSGSTEMLIPGAPFVSSTANSVQQDSYGILPVVGVQAQPVNHVWLGLAGAPPSIWLGGRRDASGEGLTSLVDLEGNGTLRHETTQLEGVARVHLPWRVNAGVAYDDRERFALALDLTLHGAQSDAWSLDYTEYISQTQTGEVPRTVTRQGTSRAEYRTVVNVAIGGEWSFAPLFALRGGFFTDGSPSEEIGTSQADAYSQRMDRYGVTLGLGAKMGSFDTTFGVVGVYGTGQFGAPNPFGLVVGDAQAVVPIDVTSKTVMLVLSGAVTVEKAKSTMEQTLGVSYLPELPGTGATGAEAWQPPPWGPLDLPGEGWRPAERVAPLPGAVLPEEVPAPRAPEPRRPAVVAQPPCLAPVLDGAFLSLVSKDYQAVRSLLEPTIARCRPLGKEQELSQGLFYLGVALAGLKDASGAQAAWGEARALDSGLVWDARLTDPRLQDAFERVPPTPPKGAAPPPPSAPPAPPLVPNPAPLPNPGGAR